MTTGRPGLAPSARWLRDRMQGLGFSEDQFAVASPPASQQLSAADLEPAHYNLEFAPLVQRVQRLLGGGRGVSIYVTGPRADLLARHHLAAQVAVGLAPLGRQVVIVDADVLRPGLSGLLSAPDAEGLVDMVRFGRSTRSLLQHPVADGPWILPSGSFPADDPAPLAADALRSVVFRISQVCDLALYVGPLPIRNDIHPLARVCDHVLCAASERADPEAGARAAEQLTDLQRNGAHVLGLVWYALPEPRLNPYETAAAAFSGPPDPTRPAADADPFAFTAAGRTELPGIAPEAPPATGDLTFEPNFLYSPDEPVAPAAGAVEAPPDWLTGNRPPAGFPAFGTELPAPAPPPGAALPFEVERFGQNAAWQAAPEPSKPLSDAAAAFLPPDAAVSPALPDWDTVFAPDPASTPAREPEFSPLPALDAPGGAAPPDADAALLRDLGFAAREAADDAAHDAAREAVSKAGTETFSRRGAGAEPEPADRMRRGRDELRSSPPGREAPAAEYAFESESNDSRWMPFVVVALVALILGFVGWALWARQRAAVQLAVPPSVTAPQDAAAHGDTPPAAGASGGAPNDGAAAGAGSAPAPVNDAAAGKVEPKTAIDAAAGKVEPKPANDAAAGKTEPKTGSQAGANVTPAPAGNDTKPAPAGNAAPPPERPAAPQTAPAVTPDGAAPKAPASTAPSATGPFGVHVASYKTLGQASKEIAQLQKAGYAANAFETDLGSKGMWFRVYVGSYSTVAEAEAARDAILKLPGYNFAQVHRLPR